MKYEIRYNPDIFMDIEVENEDELKTKMEKYIIGNFWKLAHLEKIEK